VYYLNFIFLFKNNFPKTLNNTYPLISAMFKKFLLVVSLLFFISSASSYSLTIVNPVEGFDHIPGSLSVELEADFEMETIAIYAMCGDDEHWTILTQELFIENPKETFTTNVSFFGEGSCILASSGSADNVDGVFQKNTNSGYIHFTSLPADFDGEPAMVVRNLPEMVYPGGAYRINYAYYFDEEATGIIINEHLPDSFDYSKAKFSLNNQGIEHTYDSETNILKIVLMGNPLSSGTLYYLAYFFDDELEEGQELVFGGNYVVLGHDGEIIGETTTKVAGFKLPQCPISDQDLLGYVDQWVKSELSDNVNENDEIIMQILGVWKSC